MWELLGAAVLTDSLRKHQHSKYFALIVSNIPLIAGLKKFYSAYFVLQEILIKFSEVKNSKP